MDLILGLRLKSDDSLSYVPRDYKSPLRSLAERKRLHDAVIKYRANGMSYGRIIQAVEEEFHIRLSKSHVSGWVRSIHQPDGSVRKFESIPTPALGYVIGTVLGDGSTSTGSDHNYLIKLRVKDRDFAEAFAEAIGEVLNRPPPNVHLNRRTMAWHTSVSSVLLQNFLRQPITILQDSVKHCSKCSRAFLRGLFDSEGSIFRRQLTASNGDVELLNLAMDCLRRLGIEATGPHPIRRKNETVVIKGKVWHRNLDLYYLYVRTNSLRTFAERVGFSIGRKSKALQSALGREYMDESTILSARKQRRRK